MVVTCGSIGGLVSLGGDGSGVLELVAGVATGWLRWLAGGVLGDCPCGLIEAVGDVG